MPRYGLYARKSDDDRRVTEKSIGEQVAECRRIAAADGLFVAREWEESRSALAPRNRPLWAELLGEVKAGRIDAILCWHINRLVRNMEEGGELVQLFVDGKVKEIRTPHSVHRQGDNILPLVLEAASASQYSLDLRRAVNRGMEAKFREGGWNAMAPPGYLSVRDPRNSKRGTVARDGERFGPVRKAWDMMLTGAHTLQAVADMLNGTLGYRTRTTEKRPGGPIGPSVLYQVFRNPFYAGFVRQRGELVLGLHDAMVTPQEFERMRAILSRRMVKVRKAHSHPFTGLMRCGYCGRQVTAERKRLRNGSLWDTYHCSAGSRGCTPRGMSFQKVEDVLSEAIARVSLDPETASIGLAEILGALDGQEREAEGLAKRQEAARAKCRARLDRLAEMWLGGLLTDEARYKELEARERQALNDLTLGAERARGELGHMRENARRAREYAVFSKRGFLDADPGRKREIAGALGAGMLFYGREKRIRIEIDPILLEFVSRSRSVSAPLEPPYGGSGREKEAPREETLLSGGPGGNGNEPLPERKTCSYAADLPAVLLDALAGPLFSDLGFPGIEGAA